MAIIILGFGFYRHWHGVRHGLLCWCVRSRVRQLGRGAPRACGVLLPIPHMCIFLRSVGCLCSLPALLPAACALCLLRWSVLPGACCLPAPQAFFLVDKLLVATGRWPFILTARSRSIGFFSPPSFRSFELCLMHRYRRDSNTDDCLPLVGLE